MSEKEINGYARHSCPLGGAWMEEMEQKITETHTNIQQLIANTHHLSKLETIADSITEMKDNLLGAVTGKDHIPTRVMTQVTGTFGWVILGLTVVIVFLLTGSHFNFIDQLHK